MESWRKTSLVLPTPPVAYSGTIRFTCSGTMRIRENEQHYKSKKPDPTYLPTLLRLNSGLFKIEPRIVCQIVDFFK